MRRASKLRELSIAVSDSATSSLTLRSLGISDGGFLSREMRRALWLRLMELNDQELSNAWRIEHCNFDESLMKQIGVIDADIARCVTQWDIHSDIDKALRSRLRRELKAILTSLVYKYGPSGFKYYQGLHEVGLLCLHVGNSTQAFYLLESLVMKFLRNFVYLPFNESLIPMTEAVLFVLQKADNDLHNKFVSSDCPAHFAVSWILTWFSHSFTDIGRLGRMFDFLISSNPPAIIYVCVSVLVYRRDILLDLPNEMPALHSTAQSLPAALSHSDVEKVLELSLKLERAVCSENELSSRFPEVLQDPECLRSAQVKPTRVARLLGRSAAAAGLAIAVGVAVALSTPNSLIKEVFK